MSNFFAGVLLTGSMVAFFGLISLCFSGEDIATKLMHMDMCLIVASSLLAIGFLGMFFSPERR